MSERYALSQEEIETAVASLDGWQVEDDKLIKQYKFDTFADAMGWMTRSAIIIDKMNHHPEWSNVYNRVTVMLTTHGLGNKISNLDVKLAGQLG